MGNGSCVTCKNITNDCYRTHNNMCRFYHEHDATSEDVLQDIMIKVSNNAGITSHQLLDVFSQYGVTGVYNLGLKDMYEYFEDKEMNMLIRILENDNLIVDYDKEKNMYRASVFIDNHFIDEFWFNAYREDEKIK